MIHSDKIFEVLEKDITNSKDIDELTKSKLLKNVLALKSQKLNIMITGATGAGKSSTINALFNTDIAKVGAGVDPETMDVTRYELNNLVLWDSPGLGDGKEKDNLHAKNIIAKLNELDSKQQPLIDLVLVIVDGSTKDLGTSYELINSVIIPNLGANPEDRILVGINQADNARKGRNVWDYDHNRPTPETEVFLKDKVRSVKARIKEATDVDVEPVFYAAGFKEGDEAQNPYNLSKLLYMIINKIPKAKRAVLANNNISKEEEMWQDNDDIKNYNAEIKKGIMESIIETASAGADIGRNVGKLFGKTGEAVGAMVGATAGAVWGGLKSIFGL
ncbi:50S ribosome-binding GTPase [Pseudomonas hygromyciniae]|uniref:50S ribosome-binding GTPase n=1 Tax=Pseudomonas hygromyciniae TaxID=2812000 RepID=A0ABX7JUL1_9PSED|nr:GTPase [Pseudomonas hygromyciniae]MBN0979713.1 50S ribosome-binding GTPase [Pseudomonas hygromyciniae]QSB38438.1 50S ribosome-binding GTPase [Pseudomonas hygromyciniae]